MENRYQKNNVGEKSLVEIIINMVKFSGGMFSEAPLCRAPSSLEATGEPDQSWKDFVLKPLCFFL